MAKNYNLLECHEMPFSAKINGVFCEGKVSVEGGKAYLCQNEISGANCINKLGYKYSWSLQSNFSNDTHLDSVLMFKLLLDNFSMKAVSFVSGAIISLGDLKMKIHVSEGNIVIGEYLYPTGNKVTAPMLKTDLVRQGWDIVSTSSPEESDEI